MNNTFDIGKFKVGDGQPVFIIAELSCNHQQDFELARKSVLAMKECGVDAVKLQTAKPSSITIKADTEYFKIKGGTLWDNKTLYDLYSEVYTPWEWHKPLQELSESLGMTFFSSPFDHEAVDFLEQHQVPAYKIASFEITDIPLIKYTAGKGKPIIISTGIANEEDIKDAVEACHSVGNYQIALLKCTSAYPTPLEEVNLNVIPELKRKFNTIIGLSDHTLGSLVPTGAVALGARIIEKHFILDRKLGGPDAAFSMEPHEFKAMIDTVRDLEKAMGKSEIIISEKVEKNRQFARSLFIVEDVKKGDLLTPENVRSIRPGYGIRPKHLENILGKRVTRDIEKGTPLDFNMIDAS